MKNLSKKNKARILFYSVFITAVISSVFWMKDMPGESYKGSTIQLTDSQKIKKELYLKQLNEFSNKPRNFIHSKELEKTKEFLIKELQSYGYEPNILEYGPQKFGNIEVVINSKDLKNEKGTIVIGAHYDTEGDSPGANDNGSSVVILLDLAKRLKNINTNHKLRLVFFVNEEPPFFKTKEMGSTVYANNLIATGEKVDAMYAFDVMGYYFEEDNTQHYPLLFAPFFPGKANFVAFVGGISSRKLIQDSVEAFRYNSKFPSEGVSAPSYIQGIDFSDHLSFYKHNIPALMITDTAFFRSKTYHTTEDTIDKLNINKMVRLTDELEKMFKKLYEMKQ